MCRGAPWTSTARRVTCLRAQLRRSESKAHPSGAPCGTIPRRATRQSACAHTKRKILETGSAEWQERLAPCACARPANESLAATARACHLSCACTDERMPHPLAPASISSKHAIALFCLTASVHYYFLQRASLCLLLPRSNLQRPGAGGGGGAGGAAASDGITRASTGAEEVRGARPPARPAQCSL